MADPIAILPEGRADSVFLKKLLEFRKLQQFFEIRKPAGIDIPNEINCPRCGNAFQPNKEPAGTGGFAVRLKSIKFLQDSKGIRFKHIVIVADSDLNHADEFENVQNKIREAGGYNVPDRPYVLSAPTTYPSIAVAMLPNDGAGCLETVCLAALNPKYTPKLKCVESFAKCVGADKWGKVMLAKFGVQCLLSSICEKNPYIPFKHAWTHDPAKSMHADIFRLNHEAFKPITDFLKSLVQ